MSKKDTTPVTLEKLLQLKRAERPPPEFWDSFDKALHARRLQELVERPSFRARLWYPTRRAALVFAPLAAAAAFAFFAVTDVGRDAGAPLPRQTVAAEFDAATTPVLEFASAGRERDAAAGNHAVEGPAQNRFVVESISMSAERANYRKVLYSPSIQSASRDGAVHYVAEPLAEAASRVGTASSARMRHF